MCKFIKLHICYKNYTFLENCTCFYVYLKLKYRVCNFLSQQKRNRKCKCRKMPQFTRMDVLLYFTHNYICIDECANF